MNTALPQAKVRPEAWEQNPLWAALKALANCHLRRGDALGATFPQTQNASHCVTMFLSSLLPTKLLISFESEPFEN